MKNQILILTVVIFAVSVFSSCKKSENDPLISLSSRDARITNNWVLQNLTKSIITVNALGKTESEVYSFDGTNMIETKTDFFGTTSEDTYTYTDSLEIKTGNIYSQTIIKDETRSEINSYWFWQDSDKNKIGIIFDHSYTYMIYRLAKKELLLEYSRIYVFTDENGDDMTETYIEKLSYTAE